jgi:DNA repair protein RAD7
LESDGLDESDDEEATHATKKRKTAKGKGKAVDQETPKTKRAKAAAKRKAKRDANDDGDDDYEDSDDDEYTAPARGLFSPSKKTVDPSARPPNGSFEECAECGKDFTVVSDFLPVIFACLHRCIDSLYCSIIRGSWLALP